MEASCLIGLMFPVICSRGHNEMVVLNYEAEASTVVGTPFGLSVPRLTVVTGSFVYETNGTMDLNGSDQRGHYQLLGRGGFTATFVDTAGAEYLLQGSIGPWLEAEAIEVGGERTIDTFRFWGGRGAAFPNDALPEVHATPG